MVLYPNPVELRSRGFQALVKELGWVNAVRFLRQYETGGGDYVHERDAIKERRKREKANKKKNRKKR